MKSRFVAHLAILALILSVFAATGAAPASADSGSTRKISLGGTGSLVSTGPISADGSGPEFWAGPSDTANPIAFNGTIGRSLAVRRGDNGGAGAPVGHQNDDATARPTVTKSFEGLNLFQQRYANRGNQFTVEPPDQALCVGNGYIVEAVNDVLNVFNYAGASVLPDNRLANIVLGFPTDVNHAVDLNSFYGYAPAIDRSSPTGARGPIITDPTCLYDAATQRFFLVVLTIEFDPVTGDLINHLDIAVTKTANPTLAWNIYRTPVTFDGTQNPDPANACPCLGDYPHIGADANGFYITTNSYPGNGNGFNGAQLYAYSKLQLAAGSPTVTMHHIDTFGMVNAPSDAGRTQPGFTVWPAQSPDASSFETGAGGTEYFLSSNAADEAKFPVAGTGGNYTSSQIVAWSLTNTSSLNTVPALSLTNTLVNVNKYALPPKAEQPGSGTAPGTNAPQGHCINDTTTPTLNGIGCWRLLFRPTKQPAHNEVISKLDSNDTRMQQVSYANGRLWGALDTAVSFDSNPANNKAGIAWYVVDPQVSRRGITARIANQGTFGVAGANVMYPAIGVTSSGRGVMAMTLVGANQNPSAAYATINDQGVGAVQIVAAGAAPDDGFTSYKAQVGNPPRTRWGDYGAAAVVGDTVWIASEYVAQGCDYVTWGGRFFAGGNPSTDNKLGTCAATPGAAGARTALGNWSTRITAVTYPPDESGQR